MAAERMCCVPGCGKIREDGVVLHRFPDPKKEPERFRAWCFAIKGPIMVKDERYIYKYRRVCHDHFESRYKTWSKLLIFDAVPTLFLKDPKNDASKEPPAFEEHLLPDEEIKQSDDDAESVHDEVETGKWKMETLETSDEEVSYLQVCRCCLGGEGLEDLWSVHIYGNMPEVYGSLLKQCFGIELSQMKNDKVCSECIRSLHEANAFKNVVLNVQQQLTGATVEDVKENNSCVVEFNNKFLDKKSDEDYIDENEYPTEYLESDLELGGEEVVADNSKPVEVFSGTNIQTKPQSPPKMPQQKRKSNFKIVKVVKRRVLPSRETLIRAVRAVKEGKMTLSAAKKLYDINGYCLKKIVEGNVDLEKVDLSILTARGDKKDSIEMLRMCTDFVKQGKLTKVEAAALFSIPLTTIDYRLSKGFPEDRPDQLIDTKRVDRNGVTIVEVDNKVSRDPEKFTRADRLRLEQDVKMILACTNVTPYLVLREKFVCGYCNESFYVPDELRNHVLTHGSVRNDVELLLRPAEVKEIMHLDIQDLKCGVCDSCMKWEDMYSHLKGHGVLIAELSKTRIVPFELIPYNYKCVFCDVCESRYMRLEVHMSVHFDNYICSDCGHSFMIYSKLKTHEYQEKQKKLDFKCEMCEEMIVGRTNFEKHMATAHSSPMTFPCKHCKEKFRDQYRRHLHMVEKHKSEVKPIKCEECDKEFLWKGFYLQHYRKVHLNEQKYECGKCKKRFFATHSYKKHLATHKRRDYQCY